MSEKRRDNKGRILNSGEYQKENGLYMYRYLDHFKRTKFIYSWRLTARDSLPNGKRACEPLRDMEAEIQSALAEKLAPVYSTKVTLNELFEESLNARSNLKQSTRVNYLYMYDKFVRESIGRLNIKEINYSEMYKFYNNLAKNGFKLQSIENVHTMLNPTFTAAVNDGLIRINSSSYAMQNIRKRTNWEIEKRMALTQEEQKRFLNYIKGDDHLCVWYNLFVVLLGTGLRIGEFTGLTWKDIDFKARKIHVTHSLIYGKNYEGHCEFRIETPKTRSGIRDIPMFDEVYEALRMQKQLQEKTAGFVPTPLQIDGVSDWVFTTRFGSPFNAHPINDLIKRICKSYNEAEKIKAAEEQREVVFLPHFSAHTLRHTFCTRMVEKGVSPKILQTIMGHADISTTLDIYTDIEDKVKEETFMAVNQGFFNG